MAITGRHAGDVISNTVAEVNALVCQLLGLGGHHDTVAAALIGKMLHLADPVTEILADSSLPGQIDLERDDIMCRFEAFRILLADLSVKLLLHSEIVVVFRPERGVDFGIALPIEVEQHVIDETPEVQVEILIQQPCKSIGIMSCAVKVVVLGTAFKRLYARAYQLLCEVDGLVGSVTARQFIDQRDAVLILPILPIADGGE